MARKLTELNVQFISLVKKGANGEPITVYKSSEYSGPGENMKETMVTICKVDELNHIVKGIVYKPNELDAHGDWMEPEEIKKAAHNFMKSGNIGNIDTGHNLQKVDAFVCESYIAKANDPEGYTEGAWVVAVKIEDSEVWDSISKGDYQGFSMWGKAYAIKDVVPETAEVVTEKSVEVPNTEKGGNQVGDTKVVKTEGTPEGSLSIIEKFVENMRGLFGSGPVKVEKAKDLNTDVDYSSFTSRIKSIRGNISNAINALDNTMWEIYWNDQIENGKELILQNIDEFKNYVMEVLNGGVEIQKSFFLVENRTKVGGEIIAKEADADMKAEDIQKLFEPIAKQLDEIGGRLETVEKKMTETAGTEAQVEKATEQIVKTEEKVDAVQAQVEKAAEKAVEVDVIKAALEAGIAQIEKSIGGLSDRIATVEQARGLSAQVHGTEVKKSMDPWDGVLNI